MIPECITSLMNVFDLFGFCTEHKSSRRYHRIIKIIFVLHIILAVVSTLVFIEYLNSQAQAIDTLGRINDVAKLSFELLLYWLSIWEMYLNREIQRLFFEDFRSIDTHLHDHQSFQLRSYRLKLLTQHLLGLIPHLVFLIKVILCERSVNFWCSYVFII